MIITFIRHAQSLYNVMNINSEHYRNCSITDFGIKQSKLLTGHFDLVILSPLRRAVETYSSSYIKNRHLIIDDKFREYRQYYCYSDFLDGEEIILETEAEIIQRIEECLIYLKNIQDKYNDTIQYIAIISHANFIKNFFKYVYNQEVVLDNCQTVTFQFPD